MKRFLFVLILSLLTTAALAVDRQAVIIVIDPATGNALVPEGAELRGIRIHAPDGSVRPFVTAPDERFDHARKAIAEDFSFTDPRPVMPFVTLDRSTPARPAKGGSRFTVRTNDSDDTYYVYFIDSSYMSARRLVRSVPGGTQYGVQTGAYTPAGDYDWGWLYPAQSSETHPGFNVDEYCLISGSGGYCSTPTYAYQSSGYFSAQVTSTGDIHHERSGICGSWGEPPCSDHYSDSIVIYFP